MIFAERIGSVGRFCTAGSVGLVRHLEGEFRPFDQLLVGYEVGAALASVKLETFYIDILFAVAGMIAANEPTAFCLGP